VDWRNAVTAVPEAAAVFAIGIPLVSSSRV
jgi:hypothetical protein